MITNNYTLPTSIIIDNKPFGIRDKGDFRMVFSCFNIMSNVDEIPENERLYTLLLVFYEFEDFDELMEYSEYIPELSEKMMWFIDCGQDYNKGKQSPKLIDWDKDSNLLCSAINNVAKTEIRALPYLHWWTFMGYYMAIGECSLSTIVGIRYKIAKHKKLEKYEKEFVSENPDYFNIDYRTAQQKADDDYIRAMWEGGQKVDG